MVKQRLHTAAGSIGQPAGSMLLLLFLEPVPTSMYVNVSHKDLGSISGQACEWGNVTVVLSLLKHGAIMHAVGMLRRYFPTGKFVPLEVPCTQRSTRNMFTLSDYCLLTSDLRQVKVMMLLLGSCCPNGRTVSLSH